MGPFLILLNVAHFFSSLPCLGEIKNLMWRLVLDELDDSCEDRLLSHLVKLPAVDSRMIFHKLSASMTSNWQVRSWSIPVEDH